MSPRISSDGPFHKGFIGNCSSVSSRSTIDYETAGGAALQYFDISYVRYALDYLASDSLEGRETTESGQKKAADFIAKEFKKLALKPLGDTGTYLQHFSVDVHYVSNSSFIEAGGKYFHNEKDFVVMPLGAGDTTITAPVVFAGYGFEDDSYSDYKGIDVEGKIVMLLSGNPPFADTADVLVKTELYKRSNAMKHGAAAVLFAAKEDEFEKIRQNFISMFGNNAMSLSNGKREVRTRTLMQSVYIKAEIADELLKIQGSNIDSLAKKIDSSKIPASTQLGNATVKINLACETRESENVIGILQGADSSLKKEYVVYSAHYDHLGRTAEGVIYHGADDNASGASTVLGIAKTYSRSKIRPKRSIIFLAVSGEEKGLLGSEYFTSHPTVQMGNIVADLNTDMDGRIDTSYINRDSNYVFVIGSKRLNTELDSLLVSADSESVRIKLDYAFDADNDPNQFYYRSDHYNFAKKNIPVVFFFDGNISDYHKPTDTSDKIDFPILEKRVKLIFLTGWKAANADWRFRVD
ncbi:MAG TPA: M28 family peptidase [Candidatus Acidoferrales bacterium]|nr:M28 family peptidase [Candidatus Acidoferrales bacterium]